MSRYIDADELKKYCEKCADVSKSIYDDVFEKIGRGESMESAAGAMAFFMQQERMYRFEIPNVIDNFISDNNAKIDESVGL